MKKSKLVLFFIFLLINLAIGYLFKLKITFQQILIVHVFLFSLVILTDLIRDKFLQHKNISISLLLSLNFFRIIASVIFLLPIILRQERFHKSYIYNFFICYFIYLFSEFRAKKVQKKISV